MTAAEKMKIVQNMLGMARALRCNNIAFLRHILSHVTSWHLKDSIIEVADAVFDGNYVVTQMHNDFCMIIRGVQ